jgi:hypothetical protein
MTSDPSGENVTLATKPASVRSGAAFRPVAASQIATLPVMSPVAICFPSGD